MIKKLWKENKGFTLIEIVITTVVLATISIPLLAYFSESMRHSARTKQQQNAVVAAQDAVEELKNASFSPACLWCRRWVCHLIVIETK